MSRCRERLGGVVEQVLGWLWIEVAVLVAILLVGLVPWVAYLRQSRRGASD